MYTAEESRAISRLQEAGVHLLEDREVGLLNSTGPEPLGAGAFGSCCKVQDPFSGEELVIKTFARNHLEYLVMEASILQRLQAVAGVQRLVGVCVRKRQLVSRYAGVTTDKYFSSVPSLPHLLSVLLQVGHALQGLAREGYSHNDLKGDNVCVREGRRGPEATVIDLGVARRVGTAGVQSTEEPERFTCLAPELLLYAGMCGKASDAFGLVFLVRKALSLHSGPANNPSLAPIMAWVHAALSPQPDVPLTLETVIQQLEALLESIRATPRGPDEG